MRIFVAFLVMGTIAFAAAIIVAAQALLASLPLLLVALTVIAVLRFTEMRRRKTRPTAQMTMPPPRPVTTRPVPPVRPASPWPTGWVIVPVSMVPIEAAQPPIIDRYILGEDSTRRE